MAIDPAIFKRIQKLMSLGANNDQEHEADAAMKKAAQLAEEHGLALSDIDMKTGKVLSIEQGFIHLVHARHNCWTHSLAVVIGECFDCKPIIQGNFNKNGRMIFIGTPTDIEIAMWYYKLIRLKTIRGASEKFELVKDQKMYGIGMLSSMRTRLKEMFKKEQEQIRTPTTTALVVVKIEEVKEEVARLFPKLGKAKSTFKMNGSHNAFQSGFQDGSNMTLHRGNIEGTKTASLTY